MSITDVQPRMKYLKFEKLWLKDRQDNTWLGKKNLVSSAKRKPIIVAKKLYDVSVNLWSTATKRCCTVFKWYLVILVPRHSTFAEETVELLFVARPIAIVQDRKGKKEKVNILEKCPVNILHPSTKEEKSTSAYRTSRYQVQDIKRRTLLRRKFQGVDYGVTKAKFFKKGEKGVFSAAKENSRKKLEKTTEFVEFRSHSIFNLTTNHG